MTSSIMAYIPAAAVGISGVGMVPDLTNNRYYMPSNGGSPGISQFTGLLSGACTLQKTQTELNLGAFADFPICLTYGGNLIFPAGNGSNSIELAQFRASDLSFISTAFSSSSTLGASSSTHLLASSQIVPLRYGRTDAIISTPFATNKGEISILTVPGLALTNLGNTTETKTAAIGPGKVSANLGTAYVMGKDTNAFGIYVVAFGPGVASLTNLSSFVPANIDGTWSTFSNTNGIAYDQTDGNIIIGVQTTDSVTNKSYVCKLDGATGGIIWQAAIPYNTSTTDPSWALSSIKNGRFYVISNVLGSGSNLYTINTATGAFTTTLIGDLASTMAAISEDTFDSIITYAAWSQSSTVPNYIGDYMGTGGHHGPLTAWLRFFPNGPTPPLPPAPPPTPQTPPVVSINRAWSYVLDGHTFYVIDLSSQGTFVYDQTTNQWSEFSTGALPSDGSADPQWNFQNGCMWGNRIVAGDLSTPNVWEMAPASTLDNDATQISHVSTGGISTRSRTFITCDAVRLSASFGLLDSGSSVTFNLRFSDDQGETWSAYFPITLLPGGFDTEIAWRSLGAFNAPGRIFELSDVGGLIRIDGCDAFLDGFDNDQQSQDG